MGRRSIWSNPEIISLASEFVAATDEVWRLQNGDDPECKHFQKIADVGHYRAHKSTRQGIYVCTASGQLLGSLNSHHAKSVIEMMRKGLQKYRELPQSERLLNDVSVVQPKHRWEQSYSSVQLDLTMIARDLPLSCRSDDEPHAAWNKDRVWFSREEVAAFFPKDHAQLSPGDTWTLPQMATQRLVRFSIIDTVKGQTSFYTIPQVSDSKIELTVESADQNQVRLSITGTTSAMAPQSRGRELPHGIDTKLLGTATFDLTAQKFSKFEFLALGTRWGRTVFNGRRRQLEESPVGFVFRLTPADAPLIAPSFLFAYQASWVQH